LENEKFGPNQTSKGGYELNEVDRRLTPNRSGEVKKRGRKTSPPPFNPKSETNGTAGGQRNTSLLGQRNDWKKTICTKTNRDGKKKGTDIIDMDPRKLNRGKKSFLRKKTKGRGVGRDAKKTRGCHGGLGEQKEERPQVMGSEGP